MVSYIIIISYKITVSWESHFVWELLLSPYTEAQSKKNNPLWLSLSRTQSTDWGALKFTLPPSYLEGKLRKSTTHLPFVRVFVKARNRAFTDTTRNSRSILFIICISSSKSTSLSELSKAPATGPLVIIFGIWKQQVIKVNNFSFEMSRALLRSGRATEIVQATHYQGDLRYGATVGIQRSCMSLMPVYWSTFISVTIWDGTDLDVILENGDGLFKSLNQYRLLEVDDLPRSVNIYSHSVDIFLLDNETSGITLNAYLVSLKEIIESCLNI